MELNHKLVFKFKSDIAELRCLKPTDVTNFYIEGLRNQKKFIKYNATNITLKKQQDYIYKIARSQSDIICGLFINSILIGTAGVQNILTNKMPTIGIFIFHNENRGKGLGSSILWSGSYLINQSIGVKHINANMDINNLLSLKAFLSCGYKIIEENKTEYWVGIDYKNLLKPTFINNCELVDLI
jgi:RimJ/RimL family protein N-acetyltransferase